MEIKFSDITVVVQGAVYEGITVRAVESVRRFLPGARVVFATCVPGGVPVGGDLEYIDEVTLLRALDGRTEL